jgi:acetyl esterase/lipase
LAVVRGRWLLAAGTALALVVTGTFAVDRATTTSAATDTGSSEHTATYCVDGGVPLSMSIFAPSTSTSPSDQPVPAVLQVHGGRWERGARWTSLSQSAAATDLVNAGILVASIDYRLAPENPWPDQIIDVECAVRYLRAHASELGIDPNQIAAWGTSAGGHLVSLLGTSSSDETTSWDNGQYPGVSDRVAAVVDEFGPADLTAGDWPATSSAFIRTVFGSAPESDSDALRMASPLLNVAAGDPPFLIIQGTDDQVVPPSQSIDLANRLRSAGDDVNLVMVHGGQHGLMTPDEAPSQNDIATLVTSYLVTTLRPSQ